MNPRYLLGTNICIYVLRDSASAAARRLEQCDEGEAAASVITFCEVMRGVAVGSVEELASAGRLFQLVPVLPFGVAAAETYAQMPFRRASFDRLIAAHALALDLTLVTNNERDFADVPGLRVENWSREES